MCEHEHDHKESVEESEPGTQEWFFCNYGLTFPNGMDQMSVECSHMGKWSKSVAPCAGKSIIDNMKHLST